MNVVTHQKINKLMNVVTHQKINKLMNVVAALNLYFRNNSTGICGSND